MKKLLLSASILVSSFAFVTTVSAANIFSENFGTGSDTSTIGNSWSEGGNPSDDDAEKRASGSGNDSASPDGGRFAVLFGDGGYICRTVDTTGYENVQLSYYWRGDSDAESSDDGIVELRSSGSCSSGSGWTTLQTHDLSEDGSWSTQTAFNNAAMDDDTFFLRFRVDSSSSDEHFRVDGIVIAGDLIGSNTAPVANAQTVTTNEDNAVAITLSGTDADTNPLTYATTSSPANGILAGTAPNLTFTPTANWNGTTTFTFKVNDGTVDSSNATVTVVVNAVNDAPSFSHAGNRTVNEDSGVFSYENWATAMSAGPSDEVSQVLSFLLTPSVTSLFDVLPFVSATGTLYFTPAADKNGSTSVTAKLQDDGGTANGGDNESEDTFTITINSINDDPLLGEISNATTTEGSTFNFTASATDAADNDTTFSYSLLGQPDGATIGESSGIFSWLTDENDGPGEYTFTINVSDGDGGNDSQEVTLAVTEVNQTPSVTSQEVSTHMNTARVIDMIASDNDVPAQTLTFATTSSPAYGVLSAFDGDEITYTPEENWEGEVQFDVVVTDGVATSSAATIIINVSNTAPTLDEINDISVTEGATITVSPVANDEDNDPEVQDTLTFSIDGDVPSDPDFDFDTETGAISWETDENNDGVYEVSITVSDGADQDTQSFTVTVNEENQAPVAQGQGELNTCEESQESESEESQECEESVSGGVETDEDEGISITIVATDGDVVEGDAQGLEYTIVSEPENGTLEQVGADEFFYTPDENWSGIDSFSFKANDGTESENSESNTATVYITVGPVNDLPIITLIGSNPLVYVFGQTEGVVDPWVTVTDVEDEGLTATSSRAINADLLEDYTVTYSVTDNDGATASVDRTVIILNSRVGGSGSGQVGCRDPRATNYNPAATYDGVTCVYPQVLGASTSTEGFASSTPQGEVLGAASSTLPLSCSEYISFTQGLTKKALREGARNDRGMVLLLQRFLNEHAGISLPVTGYFGKLTTAAVKKYQLAYADLILAPWGLTKPTGIVYITTVASINNHKCPELKQEVKKEELIPYAGQ